MVKIVVFSRSDEKSVDNAIHIDDFSWNSKGEYILVQVDSNLYRISYDSYNGSNTAHIVEKSSHSDHSHQSNDFSRLLKEVASDKGLVLYFTSLSEYYEYILKFLIAKEQNVNANKIDKEYS